MALRPLGFPVDNVGTAGLAQIVIERSLVEQSLGPPHRVIEDYDSAEFLGPVCLWAYEIPGFTRFVFEYLILEGYGTLYALSSDVERILVEIGVKPSAVYRLGP